MRRIAEQGLSLCETFDGYGGSADGFTLAIAHKQGDLAILDAVREVRPPFSPEQVVDDFATLPMSYKVRRIIGDRYVGEFPRELFRKRGIVYEPSEHAASDIYKNTMPLFTNPRVK